MQADFDLLILDRDLPNLAGVEICQQYKQAGGKAKVIMLTGKTSIRDRVAGLDAGADDYLTKWRNPEELSARVRATDRRSRAEEQTAAAADIIFGSLRLEPKSRQLLKEGAPVKLNAKEFR